MRILLTKLSNTHHALEIVRTDGSRERVELVTREFLFHDLLHYAVESSLGTQGGVWGALASGKTFADLNDRVGSGHEGQLRGPSGVEVVVGMMTGAVKRMETPGGEMAALRKYHNALGKELPAELNEDLVTVVRERMRRLLGALESHAVREDHGDRLGGDGRTASHGPVKILTAHGAALGRPRVAADVGEVFLPPSKGTRPWVKA